MVIESDRPRAPVSQQLSLPEGVYAWFIIFRQTHGDDEAGFEPEVIYTWSLFFRNTRGGDNAGLEPEVVYARSLIVCGALGWATSGGERLSAVRPILVYACPLGSDYNSSFDGYRAYYANT
jgi:hypothetical protein